MQLEHHPHPAVNLLMNFIFLSIGGTVYLVTQDPVKSVVLTIALSALGWITKEFLNFIKNKYGQKIISYFKWKR